MSEVAFKDSIRKIIVPVSDKITRAGEGSAVLLKDGRILLAYSRFCGSGEDHDYSDLYGGTINPEDGTFTEERIFFEDKAAVNQMSVGLERLNDGSIGFVFLRRSAQDIDDVYFSRSEDEGASWSDPVKVNSCCDEEFIVVNNDRLRQFSSGRIAVPAALYPERGNTEKPCNIAMFYSDDMGKTWSLSERVKIAQENITPPHALHPDGQTLFDDGCQYYAKEQEPGVEELDSGRILLYCRSYIGYMYKAFSNDSGTTWSPLKAAEEIICPCSPQAIRRIPNEKRLLCFFNNREAVKFGDNDNNWSWRTPLSLAVSDNNAESWKVVGNIEDDSHNYCYTSILFAEDYAFITYYESKNKTVDGVENRRNLASLKMQIIKLDNLIQ
ncbi:MAG: sialidase family protein [Planctomycetota bacterium]|jgi:hypothetical protein